MVSTHDSNWLAEHGLDLSAQYAGKWVAVHDGKVIGSGDTLIDADREARGLRPQHDYILEQINVELDTPHVD